MSEKKRRSDYKRVTSRNYLLATLTCLLPAAVQPFPTRERTVRGGNKSRINN